MHYGYAATFVSVPVALPLSYRLHYAAVAGVSDSPVVSATPKCGGSARNNSKVVNSVFKDAESVCVPLMQQDSVALHRERTQMAFGCQLERPRHR